MIRIRPISTQLVALILLVQLQGPSGCGRFIAAEEGPPQTRPHEVPIIETKPKDLNDGILVGDLRQSGGDADAILELADQIIAVTSDTEGAQSLDIPLRGFVPKTIFPAFVETPSN